MTNEPVQLTDSDRESLAVRLVQQNYDQYAASARQMMEGLEQANRELKAELAIVRGNFERITTQPWAPNSQTILAALFVTKEEIKVWLASHPAGEPC